MKFINIEGYRENCDIFNPISIDSPEEKNYCPQTYFAVNNIFQELITESEKLQARTNLDISWKNLLGEVESAPGLKDFVLDQLTWNNIHGDTTITESLGGDEVIIVNQDGENKAVKTSTLIKGAKEIIEISIGEDNTFPKIKVKDYINKIPVVTQSNKGIYITKTHTFIEDGSEGLLCKDIFVLEYSDLLTTAYVKITYRPDAIDEDILIELKQDNLYIYPFNPQGNGNCFLSDDGTYKEVPSSDYDDTEIKAQIKTNADVIAANKVDADSKLSQLGLKVNPVCLRDEFIIETTEENNVTVSFVGNNYIFAGNKNFILSNLSVNITESNFWIIYTTLSGKQLNYLKYNAASNLPSDSIILMILSNENGVKVYYSASNTYKINGIRHNNFTSDAEIDKIIGNKILIPISIRDGIRFNSSEKTISIIIAPYKDNFLFFKNSTRLLRNVPNITIDNNDYGYVVYNIQQTILEFVPFNSIANYNSNNYVLIALIHNFNNILWCCCDYFIDDEFYSISELTNIKRGVKPKTNLKYAQIGDSVTYLYDNKYETSFDDRNTSQGKTGYKNENGYGVLFAKSIGVTYENHYPQGANGRTFCDYYDEWEQGNWSFPNGINIWTIFLGTNDWGTERNPLGTKEDYLNNTYSSENRTTYGAIRKIVDKIRTQNNGKVTPKIIFITPMQRGAFAYGNPLGNFMKSAIKKDENGNWEYVSNSYGFTLKDVVDAIKWVCEYESFRYVDLFNNSIVDKNYLNMAQTLEEISDQSNWVYQDTLYDNLHPTAGIGTRKIAGRLINECKYDFYDFDLPL